MAKLIQSKICPCCLKRFSKKKNTRPSRWKNQIWCSPKCNGQRLPIKEYKQKRLQELLANTITTLNGCMEWQGNINKGGYGGSISVFSKKDSVHRHIWRLYKGIIPEGLHVLHSCDNRPCINPEHLFLGTNQSNMDDKVQKGRHNSFSKLNPDKIKEIIQLRNEGFLIRELSQKFNVSIGYIGHICTTFPLLT